MHCYLCELRDGKLTLLEHEAAKWLDQETIDSVDWLPADLQIIDDIKVEMGWAH